MELKKTTLKSDLLGECYHQYLHPSGLRIYFFPKKMSSSYALFATDFGAVDCWTDAAGKNRLPNGVAHFLEHKLFFNEDGSDSFERFTALGADANAYTSHTRTVYLFSATDHFFPALEELLYFVTHPYFTPESVEKEQGIIAEEIRMCRDNPYDRCYYNMLAGLYHAHPVKNEICGTVKSISRITDKTLYHAYQTFYAPRNMALVVCGDVDEAELLRVIEKQLPQGEVAPPAPRYRPFEPREIACERISCRGQVAKPLFCIGVKESEISPDPVERAKRDAGLTVLCEMLFSPSADLYYRLFDQGLISPEFSADYALTRDFGFLQIAGESDDPDAVLREIKAYIEEQRQNGLSEAEFERARRVEFAEYIKGFDSTEEIANTLLAFVFDDAELFRYADIVSSLCLSDVQALLDSFFKPDGFTLSIVTPQMDK